MNKYIDRTIANIALTGYKNIQQNGTIHLNKIVENTVKGLALEMLLNRLQNKKDKNIKIKKLMLGCGLVIMGVNHLNANNHQN